LRVVRTPCSSVRTRSHRAASARLCVAISDVKPSVRCNRTNNSNTAQAFCSSKFPVGSSASNTAGPVTSARAIDTRCCSPPESSPARWPARASKPTSVSHFRAIPCAEVKFSPREYGVLRLLVQHAGKVLTHKMILREVWGTETDVQYLRIYVRALRQKIEADPEQASFEDVPTVEILGYPSLTNLSKSCGVLPRANGYVEFSAAACAIQLRPNTILVSIGNGDALQALTTPDTLPTPIAEFTKY